MNVLVCGAAGFIGRHVVQALERAGHGVVHGVSPRRFRGDARTLALDFVADTDPALWRPRLAGIDAVVNAVGVLRDRPRRPMAAVHAAVPAALFAACADAGVRRVVQVSALGVADGEHAYARSKRQAEDALLALNRAGRLDGVVLRPSVVYGPGGASARLFDGLARLPALLLPAPVIAARVQPVHVADLAEGVARLLGAGRAVTGIVAAVGPSPLALVDFIASLRAQRGGRPAPHRALPAWVTACSVRVGDALPFTPWGSEALALLAVDNVADGAPFARLLGRPPRDPASFAEGAA